MASPQVFIAGRPVAALAPVGDLTLAAEWPSAGVGGAVSASMKVFLTKRERPAWIARGALADVRLGGLGMLAGKVSDVDWDRGQITIEGAAREGSTTVCLDGSNNTSSTPNTVIDAAIARGALTWSRPSSISATALTTGDSTQALNSVTDMLKQYADEGGVRLYVDASRALKVGADPTVPEFQLIAGAGELPWASEQQATRIIARWADAGGVLHTTVVGTGSTEKRVDITGLGRTTSTRVDAMCASILAKSTAGGFSGGITLASSQIMGSPDLSMLFLATARGTMVRLHGQRDPRPDRPPVNFIDFIPERAEWKVGADLITLTPRGMVARDFAAVLADSGAEGAVS